jgi:hypothetical protein
MRNALRNERRRLATPSPGPPRPEPDGPGPRLKKTPARSTLSPKGVCVKTRAADVEAAFRRAYVVDGTMPG